MLNNEKSTFNDIVYDNIYEMLKLGGEQFKAFWTDRFVTCKVPVSDPILLNLLILPGNPNKATEKDPVLTLPMMDKLQKAGKTRSELVENLLHNVLDNKMFWKTFKKHLENIFLKKGFNINNIMLTEKKYSQ